MKQTILPPLSSGLDGQPTKRVWLAAGPLSLVYENGDLRYIKFGEHEVVRRIYFAARDQAWGTAPNTLSDVRMNVRPDAFDISYTCDNRLNDIHFTWRGTLSGTADGTITCAFEGEARAAFQRNRLGYCVLHPIGVAGTAARIEKVDGSQVKSAFPKDIAPQLVVDGILQPMLPFDEMRALVHEVQSDVWCRVAFEGEIFETEDQRNWTDASFKTYGTPLRLPFPVEVHAGEKISQKVTVTLQDAHGKRPVPMDKTDQDDTADKPSPEGTTFSILTERFPLPAIGMCVPLGKKLPTKKEATRLKQLKLSHLRVDLPMWDASWTATLEMAAKEAHMLGAKLEIGLFVNEGAEKQLTTLSRTRVRPLPGFWTERVNEEVARYLVFDRSAPVTPEAVVTLARARLGAAARIYAGTNKFFTELNCNRPDATLLGLVDGLCYSFNPQVHAVDNSSIRESPEAQAETIHTYKTFSNGKPLAITPITFKPRWSLGDNSLEPATKNTEADPRQKSQFVACWTLASLKHIVQAGGANSITLFETRGPRGVLERAIVFPVYHLLADIAEFGDEVVATMSSDPLKVEGLALQKGKKTLVLIANMTDTPQTVTLIGLGISPKAKLKLTVKLLDASSMRLVTKKPETWRTKAGMEISKPVLTLPAYALARIDW